MHSNQTVLQPSIKLLQIQGPLYKQLRFRTTSSQGKIRAQPWEALEIIWRCLYPQHAFRPPQHSRQAGCVTSAVSVLTTATSMEGEEITERSAKGSVSKLHPPSTLYRHTRGSCQGCLLLKKGAREQRPHTVNPTSPSPCKTCVKYCVQKLQVLSDPVVEA